MWFFELLNDKLHVCVDEENRGEVMALRVGKKLSFVEILLTCQQVLTLCVDLFDDKASEVSRKMTPLKKSKTAPFCISRTKFVERWSKFVSAWPISPLKDLDGSLSSIDSDYDRGMECSDSPDTSNPDVTVLTEENKTHTSSSLTGIQDTVLKEKFLGTYEVHVNNLVAPHPSRTTRIVSHDHVSALTESFKEHGMGQCVILVGMLSTDVIPVNLKTETKDKVEVLGGNHTRQALQALQDQGLLNSLTVKVNLYRPLPVTAALALGYQHNAILHEKRKPMTYMDKVRLMRQCRPSADMNKEELSQWKDMLVVVFRAKDKRRLMAAYQQHMHMARLPEAMWKKVVLGTEKRGSIGDKYFRPLMRIDDNDKIKECLDSLIEYGKKQYEQQVKVFIEQGCVRSKKTAVKEQVTCLLDEKEKQKEDTYVQQYLNLKVEHDCLKQAYDKVVAENERIKEELEEMKAFQNECRGTKRPHEASCDEFSKGQKVEAFWKDENGEVWLEAKILRINKKDVTVQYVVDNGISCIPHSWMRKL